MFIAVYIKKELELELTQYYIGERYSHVVEVYLKMPSMELICRDTKHNSRVKTKEDKNTGLQWPAASETANKLIHI